MSLNRGYSNSRKQQQQEIGKTIDRLKAMFSQAEWQIAFAKREHEDLLETLGRIALRHRHNYPSVPQHIFIWTGYELLTNSKFTLVDFYA